MQAHTQELVLPIGTQPDIAALRAACWKRIADFAAWHAWLPGCTGVTLLDAGEPGRGTRFVVAGRRGDAEWQISYWNPGYRVVFQITAAAWRGACAIELLEAPASGLQLQVATEIVFQGWRRLFAPVSRRGFSRDCAAFASALQKQLPVS